MFKLHSRPVLCALLLFGSYSVLAEGFQDDFSKCPRLDSAKLGYVVWGDKEILTGFRYDPAIGNKAPGSLTCDASRFPAGKKSSGFYVKFLPVTPGNKYNLMLNTMKKGLSDSSRIVGRIYLTDKDGKSIADSTLQVRLDPAVFHDGTWKRLLLPIEIAQTRKWAEAVNACVMFGITSMDKGNVWFDELEFFVEEK